MRKYFVKNYELLHNLNDIKCPAYDKMVVPRNFGKKTHSLGELPRCLR